MGKVSIESQHDTYIEGDVVGGNKGADVPKPQAPEPEREQMDLSWLKKIVQWTIALLPALIKSSNNGK